MTPFSNADQLAIRQEVLANGRLKKEAQDALNDYILETVSEGSFANRIFSERPFTEAELRKDEDRNDTPYVLVPIEYDSFGAVTLTAGGEAPTITLNKKRVRGYFYYNSTPVIEKPSLEFLGEGQGLISAMESLEVRSLAILQDAQALSLCGGAVKTTGRIDWRAGNGTQSARNFVDATYTTSEGDLFTRHTQIQRSDFTDLQGTLEEGQRDGAPEGALPGGKFLFAKSLKRDMGLFEGDNVNTLAAALTTDGYTMQTIQGYPFIFSLKTELFVSYHPVLYIKLGTTSACVTGSIFSVTNGKETFSVTGVVFADSAAAAAKVAAFKTKFEASLTANGYHVNNGLFQSFVSGTDAWIKMTFPSNPVLIPQEKQGIVVSPNPDGKIEINKLTSAGLSVTDGGANVAIDYASDVDLYDNMYCIVDDPRYLGVLGSVVGQTMEMRVWSPEDNNKLIKRQASQLLTMIIGNTRGVAVRKLARKLSRPPGTYTTLA